MQLYAQDQNSIIVYAKNASKHHNYKCLECQSLVRLRGGIHKQNHFYHVEPDRFCRQNGKSQEHLQVQLFLKSELKNDCILEKRFKEINRIADAVCLSKKIIFEVQCSPISLEEVKSRNRDYESIGYSVIWILHDQRYNQSTLLAAEQYLQNHQHYFTNINHLRNGIIYDQFRIFDKGRPIFSTKPFPIDVKKLCQNHKFNLIERKELIPEPLFKKIHSQPFCFKGDLLDYCCSDMFLPIFELAIKSLNSGKPVELTRFQKIKLAFYQLIVRPYTIIFRMLLEKSCL